MPRIAPFEAHTDRYDAWFAEHRAAYDAELVAVRRLWPERATGDRSLEIGVGSGRFAAPLDLALGLDPSPAMLARARERGVESVLGVAEALPFATDSLDAALMVTTVCFVDDLAAAVGEAARVLRPGGSLVVGFVDAESPLGASYREQAADNPFYRDATFVSPAELVAAMEAAGFGDLAFAQTLFGPPGEATEPYEVREGTGEGSFVVVRGDLPA